MLPPFPVRPQFIKQRVQRLCTVHFAALRVDGAEKAHAAAAVPAEQPQMLLGMRGTSDLRLWKKRRGCSASTCSRLLGGGFRDGGHWHIILITTSCNQLPRHHVGQEHLVRKRLACTRGRAVRLHPLLHGIALLREIISSDDGISHDVALERHVAKLVCGRELRVAWQVCVRARVITYQAASELLS